MFEGVEGDSALKRGSGVAEFVSGNRMGKLVDGDGYNQAGGPDKEDNWIVKKFQ